MRDGIRPCQLQGGPDITLRDEGSAASGVDPVRVTADMCSYLGLYEDSEIGGS